MYRLRSHPAYRKTFDAITQHVLPFVFGFGCLAAVVLILVGTGNRMWFAARGATGSTCIDAAPRNWNGTPIEVKLSSHELCQQTGLVLREGQRYRVEIVVPDNGDWKDRSIPVLSPEGFSSGERPIFVAALPFRRVLTAQWFVPLVRIGNRLAEYHRLDRIEEIPPSLGQQRRPGDKRKVRGFAEFTPKFTGQMFLFVNDAILPGPWVKTLYNNNGGTASVTVSAIEPELGND